MKELQLAQGMKDPITQRRVWYLYDEHSQEVATTRSLELAQLLKLAVELKGWWSCCYTSGCPEADELLEKITEINLDDPKPALDSPSESGPEAVKREEDHPRDDYLKSAGYNRGQIRLLKLAVELRAVRLASIGCTDGKAATVDPQAALVEQELVRRIAGVELDDPTAENDPDAGEREAEEVQPDEDYPNDIEYERGLGPLKDEPPF